MNFTLIPNTAYASSNRDGYEAILADYELITGRGMAVAVLDSFHEPLIVLNEKRQIIFINRAFMELLELDKPVEALGYRLGEILDCKQASKDLGGCGTRKACRNCGVVNAMLAALNGTPAHENARIEVEKNDSQALLELMIETAPIPFWGRRFVRLTLKKCTERG